MNDVDLGHVDVDADVKKIRRKLNFCTWELLHPVSDIGYADSDAEQDVKNTEGFFIS